MKKSPWKEMTKNCENIYLLGEIVFIALSFFSCTVSLINHCTKIVMMTFNNINLFSIVLNARAFTFKLIQLKFKLIYLCQIQINLNQIQINLCLSQIQINQSHYASPSSGEAYRDQQLTTNFEL